MKPFSEELFKSFQETLGLKESPLGAYYTNEKPDGITAKEGIHLSIPARSLSRLQPHLYHTSHGNVADCDHHKTLL